MPSRITVIAGPPCAGKSTLAAARAGARDVVLDQDVMGAAAWNRAVQALRAGSGPRAWVIRCLPGPTRRAAWVAELGAELVLLTPDLTTLLDRAAARPQPHRHRAAVLAWVEAERADRPARGGRGRRADPSPRVNAWW